VNSELKAPKTYELVIFEWRAIIPPEWTLEARNADGDWRPVLPALALELHCGDQLRSTGGPEAEYLEAMLEHGYLKEVRTQKTEVRMGKSPDS
jgi:hypothetical protein